MILIIAVLLCFAVPLTTESYLTHYENQLPKYRVQCFNKNRTLMHFEEVKHFDFNKAVKENNTIVKCTLEVLK